MLGTPDGLLPVDDDLALEQAGNARIKRPRRRGTSRLTHEREVIRSGHLAEEIHEVDHRVVVERDVFRVALRRERLRPTAVRILRGEDVIDSLQHGGTAGWGVRGTIRSREKANLVHR